MLVLTRKLGQRVVVAQHIVLTVLECSGSCVRLGIEAPQEVRILRGELVSEFQNDPHLPPDLPKSPPKG